MPPFHFSDDVEKKPLTWQYIRKVAGNFVHYYRPHIGLFRLSVGCALVNSGLTILVPLLVYRAYGQITFIEREVAPVGHTDKACSLAAEHKAEAEEEEQE